VYGGLDQLTGKEIRLRETVSARATKRETEREATKVQTRLLNQVDERRSPRTEATINQLLDKWLEVLDVERGDALVLANILRTDRASHRPLPTDSELARAIAVLARAQQDAVWDRTGAHNKLRSVLREYYPSILAAFAAKAGGSLRPEARVILAAAPTPGAAAKLTTTRLRALLVRAGRERSIHRDADRLHAVLRARYLHHPPLVEDAFGIQALALLRQLDTACANVDELAAATVAKFENHPDAAIITSLPGLGLLTGARLLAEIGDDRARFTDAKSLKPYAGAAPVTRASGKSLIVSHRRIKNQRLAAAGYV
jgi:transposase